MPGVVDVSDGRDSPSPTSIQNIYILGGRQDAKNMTIDGQTIQDRTVTVRDRDAMTQVRVGLDQVKGYLGERL